MTQHTRNIKDLSIALEALTRVPDAGPSRYTIERLLAHEIEALTKEQHPLTTHRPPPPPNRIEPDYEIPF